MNIAQQSALVSNQSLQLVYQSTGCNLKTAAGPKSPIDPSLEVRLAQPVCTKPVPSALKPAARAHDPHSRDQHATPQRERLAGKVLVYPSSGSVDERHSPEPRCSIDLGAQLAGPCKAAVTPQLGNAVRFSLLS